MILVTGATGLVGGNLLWYLLQQNERVVAIHRPSSNVQALRTIFSFYSPEPDKFLERIDWRIADMLDINSIRAALCEVTTIYHCAAIVSLGGNSDTILNTNILGTKNIVTAALEAKVDRFCFVSSIAACGEDKNKTEIDENSTWTDYPARSFYSKSKYESEQEVWKGISQGLNAVIVNPGVILGISGNENGSAQLFSQVRKGLLFYTNGGSGYVDVSDVAKAMILLTNSDISGERYILVGENCSNKDILGWMADGFNKRRPFIPIGEKILWLAGFIAELVGRIFNFTPVIDRGTARSATNREYYSNRKIIQATGFAFTPIEQCISEVCKFLLEK